MIDDLPLERERERVSELGREMLAEDLTVGTGGNLSERRGDRIAVSPSGIPYGDVTPADVPVVDPHGEVIAGDLSPTSETPMHTAIYRAREAVGGVVHTHSPYASTFASLGEPVPPSNYLIAFAGHEVPVAGYAPPGSDELAVMAVETLGEECDACLLKHHGVMALGATLADAFETAQMVEHAARVHYQAASIGDPELLDEAELDHLREMFRDYGPQSADED
jgi:L-fuculose-phosphate aldolase